MRQQLAAAALVLLALGLQPPRIHAEPLAINSAQLTLIDEVELAAREAGQLTSVPVSEGKLVTDGDPVAQIDDTEARLVRNRAKAEAAIAKKEAGSDIKIRFAQKSHEVAQAELRRAKESIEKYKKSISDTELDRLQLAVDRTALEVEQARHDQQIASLTFELKRSEVDVAEHSIARRKISAPLNGVVVELKRRQGEWVQPGDVVARIVRIDRVRAEGFLPAKQVTPSLVGAPVMLEIELAGTPTAKFPGKLAFISPEVNPVNGQVRVWAEIENRDMLLRPGLQGKLVIGASP
jgi:multidrug efflux pump subunit AcrA (membrane-fusion protein)